ncbi:hypothetical protein V6N13_047226 [Hibiscus sabdariffa]
MAINGDESRRGGIITLFVSNIPTKLHWSGLREAFGRHGDLVDAYIAKKVDKQGLRVGFVRFSNRKDAYRALERLNGFKPYGFRLRVSVARFNVRATFWRRKKETAKYKMRETKEDAERPLKQSQETDKGITMGMERGPCSHQVKIQGHVENESLWKLSKCLVGSMATDCSVESVKDMLHTWGLGDTKVKSLGGKNFLLQIEDEELLKLLEEQKWSLLEEVFTQVDYWTESFRVQERTIWV